MIPGSHLEKKQHKMMFKKSVVHSLHTLTILIYELSTVLIQSPCKQSLLFSSF